MKRSTALVALTGTFIISGALCACATVENVIGNKNANTTATSPAATEFDAKCAKLDGYMGTQWENALSTGGYSQAYAVETESETERYEISDGRANADDTYPRLTIITPDQMLCYTEPPDTDDLIVMSHALAQRDVEYIYVSYSTSSSVFNYAVYLNESTIEAGQKATTEKTTAVIAAAEADGNVGIANKMREVSALLDE